MAGLFGKRIIVFYRNSGNELQRICGSDGVYIPDQRLGICRLLKEGAEQAKRALRKPAAFRIEVWNGFSESSEYPITEYIRL